MENLNNIFSQKIRKILVVVFIFAIAVLMFVYHDFLNQDILILSLLFISLLLGNLSTFIRDWTPLFLFYFAYEFTRGHLNTIQKFLHINVNESLLYQADKLIFGPNIPILWTQKLIKPYVTILDYISFLWYTSFFWLPIFAGYIFWLKDRRYFKFFRNAYLIICFLALITYLVFPAAPPWMASQLGILPHLNTNTWGRLYVGSLSIGLFKAVGTNPVAPFPSLHVGWSVLSAYMIQNFLKKRLKWISYLFYIYPLVMCFVVTYTSDHYVVDMIGGIVYATIAILIARRITKSTSEKRTSLLWR